MYDLKCDKCGQLTHSEDDHIVTESGEYLCLACVTPTYAIQTTCNRKKEIHPSGLTMQQAKDILRRFWNNYVGEDGSYYTGAKLKMVLNNEPTIVMEIVPA